MELQFTETQTKPLRLILDKDEKMFIEEIRRLRKLYYKMRRKNIQ